MVPVLKVAGAVLCVVFGLFAPPALWAAQTRVVFSFDNRATGQLPTAGMVIDANGVLYGTTFTGGSANVGVLFSLTPAGVETVLHNFQSSIDGSRPNGDLTMDTSGAIYGTTQSGGTAGAGTVFKFANGVFSVLYTLPGGLGGAAPKGRLVFDQSGNLYGTTSDGGWNHCGVVFMVAPNGSGSVFHTYSGGSDSTHPYRSSLIIDAQGNLYGTTYEGGTTYKGTVFKISPDGTESVLHSFATTPGDGSGPFSGVISDAAGNLYGTTIAGGAYRQGAVFRLSPGGTETILYSFNGGAQGALPFGGLIMDSSGALYGTTVKGGITSHPCGAVFEVPPGGQGIALHTFTDTSDGCGPRSTLTLGSQGNIYGTTVYGGNKGGGTVFNVTPN